jgi:hypothetical protein
MNTLETIKFTFSSFAELKDIYMYWIFEGSIVCGNTAIFWQFEQFGYLYKIHYCV